MTNQDDQNQIDRKFLHDLATPITVVKSVVKLMIQELNGSREPSSLEKHQERLERVVASIEKIEELHADHKARLYSRETATSKKAG